ncbi:hypothetical protein [Syntrophus aciditrophicus]|jgi:hypothetical protein|uniref:hypothetical protein n=1 Tax=Syntrophus aciditrophicus TaxID=316277 RepID=UPI0009C648EE|nr:hypothetical protein [Syntrophus aciditrophicus]OPY16167.1 MAG: hypothetical protein A4E74_01985 [Syntrophus sp. PtaB.Bin075]
MSRKSPQQFVKRQKEMERARKAREKMAKRQEKKECLVTEKDLSENSDQLISNET